MSSSATLVEGLARRGLWLMCINNWERTHGSGSVVGRERGVSLDLVAAYTTVATAAVMTELEGFGGLLGSATALSDLSLMSSLSPAQLRGSRLTWS